MSKLIQEVNCSVTINVEPVPFAGMITLIESKHKELTDEEIADFTHRMVLCCGVHPNSVNINVLGLKFIVEDILRKAQEK